MQVVTCKNRDVPAVRLKQDPPVPPSMRRRLIDAAREEFGEKGIDAATTRGIAERAGCNEVTLFRHFETKQKLLAAVVHETSDEFRSLCECREGMTGELRADLLRFATVYNASMERCEGMARVLIGEGRRQPNLAKELIGDVLGPFHRSIECYLKERMEAGVVRKDLKVAAFAEVFTAALMGGMLRRTSGLSKLKREGWLQQTVDLMARSVEV
jgi:AcrR family transcriptional regulator